MPNGKLQHIHYQCTEDGYCVEKTINGFYFGARSIPTIKGHKLISNVSWPLTFIIR